MVQDRWSGCSWSGITGQRFYKLCELSEEGSSNFEVITKNSLLFRSSEPRLIREPAKTQSIFWNPVLRRKAEFFDEDKEVVPRRYRRYPITMWGFFNGSPDIFFYPSHYSYQYVLHDEVIGIEIPKGCYIFGIAKAGEHGQTITPKDIREIFGIQAGDTLIVLSDRRWGIVMTKADVLQKHAGEIFEKTEETPNDESV